MAPRSRLSARTLACAVGVGLILVTHPYIDLGIAVDLPLPGTDRVWQADAPVADVAALALLPAALWASAARRGAALPAPIGLLGWGVLLLASALSLAHALDPSAALHHLVRKPLLVYLLYGFGLARVVALLPPHRTTRILAMSALALAALVSVGSSAGRLLAGDGLWYQALAGLTPNHKTLAVCLAGWMPLLLTWRRDPHATSRLRRAADLTLALAMAAVLASLSKTAWLGAGLALALAWPLRRPLAWRPRLILPLAAVGVALAYYAPVLVGSRTMLDAARSRHSLNVRSWQMLRAHPLVGSGSGMSTRVEMATFPHYRVNGVDAHGALQKVGAEAGLMGILGLGLFVGGGGRRLVLDWRRQRAQAPMEEPTALPAYGALATFAVLHGQLLLSTELFSPTHWVPLATAWGLAQAHRAPEGGPPCAS